MVYEVSFKVEGFYKASSKNGTAGIWDKFNDEDFGGLDDPAARIELEEEEEDGAISAIVSVSSPYTLSVGAPSREEAVDMAFEIAEGESFGPLEGITVTFTKVELDPESLAYLG